MLGMLHRDLIMIDIDIDIDMGLLYQSQNNLNNTVCYATWVC